MALNWLCFHPHRDGLEHGSRHLNPWITFHHAHAGAVDDPTTAMVIWLGVFVFTGMLITLVSLQRLWRRDRDGVQALIGVKSIDEQIKDESV